MRHIKRHGGVSGSPISDGSVFALGKGAEIVQGMDRAGHHDFLRLLSPHVNQDLVEATDAWVSIR